MRFSREQLIGGLVLLAIVWLVIIHYLMFFRE
jgi:hypothetical protein